MSSKMTEEQSNPWVATSWEELTYVCCPECVFKSHEKTSFYAHAIQNHPKSEAFFNSEYKNHLFEQSFQDDHASPDFLDPWNIKIEPEDSKRLLEAKSEYSLDHPNYELDTKPSIDSLLDSKDQIVKPKKKKHKKTLSKINAENRTSFKCSTCSNVFNNKDDLRLHRKTEHNLIKKFKGSIDTKCTFCSKEFKGMYELWNHNKDEHNSPFLKCEECDKTFENPKSMYQHKKTHITTPCQFCGKFISSTNMRKHIEVMHSGADKSAPAFMCEHCSFTTTQKRYLHMHKKNSKCQERFDEKTQTYIGYTCRICNEHFSASKYAENSYLKHYTSIHHSLPPEFENKEQFLCQQCPQTFFNIRNLNWHTERIHGSGKKSLKVR